MLMRLIFLGCALVAAITFADWASSPIEPCKVVFKEGRDAKKDNQSSQEYCSTGKVIGAWRVVGKLVDDWHDDILAASTVVIAVFTLTIWLTGRNELNHSQQVERAYLSGGGAPEYEEFTTMTTGAYVPRKPHLAPKPMKHVRDTGWFRLDINNHGKTKGQIIEYGYGWCEVDKVADLPERPVYKWVYYRDQIGPGTQSRPIKRVRMPIGKPIIFGRYGYVDIFGNRHSDGFIQHRGNPIAPPHPSYTEADPAWDLPDIGRRKYEQEES
jgi:hypothetical protein